MLKSARALAYTIWRLAKPNSNEIFGGGAENNTRGACALESFQ